MSFPIRVVVYIKVEEKIKTRKNEQVSATFFAPYEKSMEPYIKIATGDYKNLVKKEGKEQALCLLLCSLAHELIHYQQWLDDLSFNEREAENKGKEIIMKYLEYRKYPLTFDVDLIKMLEKGNNYLNNENYSDTIAVYDKILIYNTKVDIVYSNKGFALDKLVRFEEAIKCYNKAIEITSDDSNIFCNKGYSLLNLKKYDEAIKSFDKAIELDANNENPLIYKGYALESLQKYKEAIECLDKAIIKNPDNELIYNDKGFILLELKRYDEALQCFDKAIEIDVEYTEAFYNKSIVYAQLGDLNNAIVNLKKAIKLDEDYIQYASEENWFDGIKDSKKFIELIEN